MQGREAIEREVEARLAERLPEVELLEVTLVGRGGSATLRAVIDHPAGVDHDLCARVTRVLDDAGMLDRYGVEVSSPGPQRPLRTPEHFARAVGRRVQLKLAEPTVDGRRSYSGTLVEVGPETLTVASGEGVAQIRVDAVRRARLTEEGPR